jgi:nicotinate-nucleotide adenylyltransferase
VPRDGAEIPILPFDAGRLVRLKMPYIGISSTDLRLRARAGLSLRYLVSAAVESYIKEQGLYRL